jgi:transposase-like protein
MATAASPPEPAPASAAKPEAAPTPKRTSARRASRKPSARKRPAAAPGPRQQDVLRLVRERPGITVADLANEFGVDATGLYGVVRRLQSNGQIRKDGPQLRPADAATTTTDASPTSEAPSTGRAPTPPAEFKQQTTEPPASKS